MIDKLERFAAIGWDFDGTLIDHPNAPLMHTFINEHPEKQHVIITFRTHGMERTMFHEMAAKYPNAPEKHQFDAVFNISDRAWAAFTNAQDQRSMGRLDGRLTPWEMYYVNWKGLVCSLRHLPVLVDDKAEDVLPGCKKFGIVFVHPNEL